MFTVLRVRSINHAFVEKDFKMKRDITPVDQENQIQSMSAALEGEVQQSINWTADFSASGVGKNNDDEDVPG